MGRGGQALSLAVVLAGFSGLLARGGETPAAPPAASSPAEVPEVSVHTIESTNFDADFSPGEATTNVPAELDEIYGDNDGFFDRWGVNRPLDLLEDPLEDLFQKTGLRLGVAYTMLFLQPMGGRSSKSGAAGDLDFLGSWTIVGRGTENTGRLVMSTEYRFIIGDQPPSRIGGQMGTLIPPSNAFNDRGWVVRDLYWVQRLYEGRLRLLIGRADPSDFVGSFWLQNVNNSFVNRHFSANPAVPFPDHGPTLGISVRPNDLFYVTGGVSNGYSRTIRVEVDSLFSEWDLFAFGEAGYTPTFDKLGAGRYALGLWYMDEREMRGLPADYGLTAVVDQNLGEYLQVFARYAYSDGTLTNVRHLAQTGLGVSGLFGRDDDLTGLGFSMAVPRNTTTEIETVLETFHRFQVTQNSQFSVGLQLIANPGNAWSDGAAGAFYMRLRTSF